MSNINIGKYLERIGCRRTCLEPTFETLREIHLAHTQSIPFENLDALLRRPISIDPASLFEKLVVAGRGGWCFEQNGLLREVLIELGFNVTDIGARVLIVDPPARDEDLMSRTHRLMRVRIDGQDWLADVGFGGYTLDTPIRLVEDIVQTTAKGAFSLKRVTKEKPSDKKGSNRTMGAHSLAEVLEPVEFVLRYHVDGRVDGAPKDMYRFGFESHYYSDWVMANHYMCTFPGVIFQNMAMLSINRADGQKRTYASSASNSRTFANAEDFRQYVYDTFGIRSDDKRHGISLEEFQLIAERAGVQIGVVSGDEAAAKM